MNVYGVPGPLKPRRLFIILWGCELCLLFSLILQMRREILKEITNLTQTTWWLAVKTWDLNPLLGHKKSIYCPNILLPNIQMKYFMCLQREWEENNTCCGSGINASKLSALLTDFCSSTKIFLDIYMVSFSFPLLEFSCSDFFFPSLQKFSSYNSGEE